jgi:alpha-glucoside transport system permease protein
VGRARQIRPWLWLAPALLILAFFLVYPTINTIYLSLLSRNSTSFVGLANYAHFFTNRADLQALRNNIYWVVFLTGLTISFGLICAIVFERIRFEALAKSVVFLPLAISFVAAGVIWKLMYDYQPPGKPQTGTFDAVVTLLGQHPIPWLIDPLTNNAALIIVGVWMWTGFAMVILSAGLKGISKELLEAARVDGATELQVFARIILPIMSPTIAVVATTIVITALKAFDIVYVMTAGNYGTDVIANRMYEEMFNNTNFGRASAIAVVLLLAIVPVMLININRFRQQESIR